MTSTSTACPKCGRLPDFCDHREIVAMQLAEPVAVCADVDCSVEYPTGNPRQPSLTSSAIETLDRLLDMPADELKAKCDEIETPLGKPDYPHLALTLIAEYKAHIAQIETENAKLRAALKYIADHAWTADSRWAMEFTDVANEALNGGISGGG